MIPPPTPVKLWSTPLLQCVAGYHGSNCSEEINECLSQPCQNGGTCIDLTNTYKCSCPRGTQGKAGGLGGMGRIQPALTPSCLVGPRGCKTKVLVEWHCDIFPEFSSEPIAGLGHIGQHITSIIS